MPALQEGCEVRELEEGREAHSAVPVQTRALCAHSGEGPPLQVPLLSSIPMDTCLLPATHPIAAVEVGDGTLLSSAENPSLCSHLILAPSPQPIPQQVPQRLLGVMVPRLRLQDSLVVSSDGSPSASHTAQHTPPCAEIGLCGRGPRRAEPGLRHDAHPQCPHL